MRVSYSWSNQPSGMTSKLPSDEYYHYGDNVIIDTTYNNKSGYKEESVGEWDKAWKSGDMGTQNNLTSICYGNGKFVAVGSSGKDSGLYSTDGITWNTSNTPTGSFNTICYGNGKFVAVGGTYRNTAIYSTDGITWNTSTLPATGNWQALAYGNNRFVTADFASNAAAYSTDGITWTKSTMPYSSSWISMCYGNGKFVCARNGSSGIAYSTDGITWLSNSTPSMSSWQSICYGNGKFVIVAGYTTVAYSSDAITWTEVNGLTSRTWKCVNYANGYYITLGYNSNVFAYSTDAVTWTEGKLPYTDYWYSWAYGDGKMIAVIHGEQVYAYIDLKQIIYYQFSGWDKSDFNITSDTSVTGSWSQVSSGGGVNFSELSIGDTFMLGKYQVENENPWDIEWEIVHQTDDYQIAMTKQIIDLRPFDGKESSNTDSNRKTYGNNNWTVSNIKQWLNSDQASWYSSQHQYDAPPNDNNCHKYTKDGTTVTNAYESHKGFLYYWSADEKSLLKDMTLTLANNTVTDGGGSYTWTGKVFLPTYTQMGGGQNNSISEGEAFSKFTNNSSRVKSLHDMVKANNPYAKLYNSSGNRYYWMSSAHPSNSYDVRLVYSDGSVGDNGTACYGANGLTPCICLPRTGWQYTVTPDLNYTT